MATVFWDRKSYFDGIHGMWHDLIQRDSSASTKGDSELPKRNQGLSFFMIVYTVAATKRLLQNF